MAVICLGADQATDFSLFSDGIFLSDFTPKKMSLCKQKLHRKQYNVGA